jgi:hypothetical protein
VIASALLLIGSAEGVLFL